MALNGAQLPNTAQNVLEALIAMRGRDAAKKKVVLEYLGKFQKSPDAWPTTFALLESGPDVEAKLFAAQTLKGKITFDLVTEVPTSQLPALREQILLYLKRFAPGPKPVRIQLCVCLAILAIQMREWKSVLQDVVSALANEVESHACMLDFLRILPEEVTEGRKITLSGDELAERTVELLGDNAMQVVQLLINYAQSSAAAAVNPQLFECITSWLREVPVSDVVKSPLLDMVMNGLENDSSFQEAADCLATMCLETRDVDENVDSIQILLPKVAGLQPRIQKFALVEDIDSYKALTRVFADSGESWVVAIAREPVAFMPLVNALLECAARDKDRDVIGYTFKFWYELKQLITLNRFSQSRDLFGDVYSRLVDIIFRHLQYPEVEDGNELDLFDGNREEEDKFRHFRHQMGDTLKDACEVLGTTACLTKVHAALKTWMQKYGSLATGTSIPHWQALEAPLFAMRAMGREVDPNEDTVIPQIMPILVKIPAHEKLQFAATLVMGRYTEWTAAHPEFLQNQIQYVIGAFASGQQEILRAAAQSLRYFFVDCKRHLVDQISHLIQFYHQQWQTLPDVSQEELTEGVAHVVAVQSLSSMYPILKEACSPIIEELMKKADHAKKNPQDAQAKLRVADDLQLVALFVQNVNPYVDAGVEHPAVKYWEEVFPVLSAIMDNFPNSTPICERITRCWRLMVQSYRIFMTPLLMQLATKLAEGFERSRQGCFLWATAAIVREFSHDREDVDAQTTESIYVFFEQQARVALRIMSDVSPADAPDLIDDFFRLLSDALLYHPQKLIPSDLFTPIFEAAIVSLSLEQYGPLTASLNYIRDLLTYGGPNPATSMDLGNMEAPIRQAVQQLILSRGEPLIQQTIKGMMNTFPRDCFSNGSGVLLGMFQLLPTQTTDWVERSIQALSQSQAAIAPQTTQQLVSKIRQKLSGDSPASLRQVRALLQDFTNDYRRRYVAPRDGLGLPETVQFHFEG